MRLQNKLTPYPILSSDNDNYLRSRFEAMINVEKQNELISIFADFLLENNEINELIGSGEARFAVHVECPASSYRKMTYSSVLHCEIPINANELTDKVEICTFIIATKDLPEFHSTDFHPDYLDFDFAVNKGSLLAIGPSLEIIIQKNPDDMENLPSIFKVIRKMDSANGSLSVNTDGDYVQVELKEELFDLYYSLGRSKYQSLIFSMIMIPSVMTVLSRMKDADGDTREKKWYRVIEETLEEFDCTPDNLDLENSKRSLLALSQKMLGDSINGAVNDLNRMG